MNVRTYRVSYHEEILQIGCKGELSKTAPPPPGINKRFSKIVSFFFMYTNILFIEQEISENSKQGEMFRHPQPP